MRTHAVAGQSAGRTETGRAVENLRAEHAVRQDRLLGVDVSQEGVQRPGSLREALGQLCPLVGGHDSRHQIKRVHLHTAVPGGPERDVAGTAFLLDVAVAGAQHIDAEALDRLQCRLVVRACPPVGIDGFVVAGEHVVGGFAGLAGGLICREQATIVRYRRGGGLDAPSGLGDELIYDVGEAAAAAQRPPLPSRGRTGEQGLAGQFADHLPVAAGFELRSQRGHQIVDHVPGRSARRDGPGEVDEVALEPRAGSTPERRAAHRRGKRRRGGAGADRFGLPSDGGPVQSGDQHDGVHRRAAVAHSQF